MRAHAPWDLEAGVLTKRPFRGVSRVRCPGLVTPEELLGSWDVGAGAGSWDRRREGERPPREEM